MIISATNTTVEINTGKLSFGTNLINNFNNLIGNDSGYFRSLINSAIITVITVVLALFVSSMAGYGFEIFKSKGKERLFKALLLSMMVPFSALMIPLFKLFTNMRNGWLSFIGINTFASVIIPSVSTAFLIFLFRQNTKSFPIDILEAARIDGLTEFKIFLKMYMPIMKSTYSAAAIITFMNSWNNYLWPLIALQSPSKRTVPLVLSTLGSSYTPDYGMIMFGIVIATIPTALIFFIMQKQFVQGMLGSVK